MFSDTTAETQPAPGTIDTLITFPARIPEKYDVRAERKALAAHGITSRIILDTVFACVADGLTPTPYGTIDLKISPQLRNQALRALRMKGLIKDTDKYVAQLTVQGFFRGGWKYWFAEPDVPAALQQYRRRNESSASEREILK